MNVSFQEKSAWITLFALLASFSFYFYLVFWIDLPARANIVLFIGAVIVLVVIQIVLHTVVAIGNPQEANAGADERDSLFELKATSVASYVLGFGALVSASTWLFGFTPRMMANSILLSLVLAEVVQAVTQLYYYRRGV